MGQTLTHGVYLPDEGERNCYSGLAANWQILDTSVGTIAAHTAALAGKAPAVHTHTKSDITDFPAYGTTAGTICEGNDSRLSDARTPVAHTHTKSDVTDLLNSNFIPSANNSYDLGSSSYQWNNLYAKNYFYNGTAWGLDKENAWSGNNRFSKNSALSDITSYTDTSMSFTGNSNTIFFNTRGSSNYASFGTFLFAGYMSGTAPDRYGQLKLLRSTDKKGDTNDGYVPDSSFNLWRVAPHYLVMDMMEAVRVTNNGNENSLKPITNNATDLGTSTNKWKTLNGVNPGALSLPDYDRFEPIDFSQYDVNLGWNNLYTPSEDGWLYAEIDDTATNSIYIYSSGLQPVQSVNRKYGVSAQGNGSQSGYGGRLAIMIPVRKNIQYRFLIKASAVSDIYAVIFYPCLGNV